jgi:hypothetical protein
VPAISTPEDAEALIGCVVLGARGLLLSPSSFPFRCVSTSAIPLNLEHLLRRRQQRFFVLPLSPIDELSDLLSGASRVIMIVERDVDLRSLGGENNLFVLKIAEGSLAAGGRGGGFGERRVVSVKLFHYRDGACEKLFETEEEPKLAAFEVPYHVARMPFVRRDGTDGMGYGVVEPDLVREYMGKTT